MRAHTGSIRRVVEGTTAISSDGLELLDAVANADETLLMRIAGGDVHAFERLYDQYSGTVYSLALAMVHHRPTAEEITQEVFLGIWRGAREFDARRGPVRSWVLALAHHKSVDAVRRERFRVTEPIPEQTSDGSDVVAEALRRADAARVREALQGLPAEQRTAIALAYYAGYTQQEISQRLSVPLGTIKTRIRDGLIRLRSQLAHTGTVR